MKTIVVFGAESKLNITGKNTAIILCTHAQEKGSTAVSPLVLKSAAWKTCWSRGSVVVLQAGPGLQTTF